MLLALAMPLSAMADEQALQQKIDDLQKKVDKIEEKSLGRWLTIGGDYRFRYDYLRGDVPAYFQLNPRNKQANGSDLFLPVPDTRVTNNAQYTNRFGLDLKAKATQDVTVTARLLMYKVAGEQDDAAIRGTASSGNIGVGPFFADRAGIFDGTVGHVPSDNKLAVDRVYATWNNIAEQPIWFSIGRRPSTGGIPSHLKQNNERPGNSGVPQLLVDYAFDGLTLGYAPDIEGLTGAYAKFCYGRGFENGLSTNTGNSLKDTDMYGINVVPYDTDPLRIAFQYNRGMNIFDSPIMQTGPFAGARPSHNLGDIDWYGVDVLGNVKNAGMGSFNWFASGGISNTHPNADTVKIALQTPITGFTDAAGNLDTQSGLMYTGKQESKLGWAAYVGGRYDIPTTATKVGFEYNHGSKNWITFAPAADDMWTAKVGTRGDVYEGYIIQELKLKPISSYLSKTFFRVGYQYYSFDYTGSNNWVGAPVKISNLQAMGPMGPANGQMFTPLKSAQNIYVTFEVKF